MPHTLEHKIRVNAILIYLVVSLICAGMVAYTYYIKADIKEQKERITQYYEDAVLANRMIEKVNQSQIEANRYVETRRTKHYQAFQQNLLEVEALVDSLRMAARDSSQYGLLIEIESLLKEKGRIILQLNRQFRNAGTPEVLDELLGQYTPAVQEVVVSTTVEDTLVQVVPRKGFWRKLSGLFSSDTDTMITRSVVKTDTLKVIKPDSIHLANEMSGIVEKVEEEYKSRLSNIERQVNSLIRADHEISIKIYSALTNLYDTILYTRWSEVQRSDKIASNNSTYSMISGAIALVLILLFVILIFQDVSRAYKMRKMLEEANERTTQIMQSRHRLLLSVSHDVKTPLNAILGNLELKGAGGKFEPEDLYAMQNAGKHILTLLENLLHFSALEQGQLKKEEQPFYLHELCDEVRTLFYPLTEQKNLQFITSFDFPKDLYVQGDELRIKQIIINVLSNAVKYTKSGTVKLEIEYPNKRLWCKVADTGVGIPKDRIESVFEPFSRIKENVSMAAGSGFGMYVVKGLVDLLDGSIRITSEEGKGTDVTLIIPLTELPARKTDDLPKRILLIDDDVAFLAMLETMLSCLGHTVSVCRTADKFEQEVRMPEQYDLVLTDMQMGAFSGIDVLKSVRRYAADKPVVLMTASSDYSENDARQQGFDAYLKKPVGLSSLQRVVGGQKILNMSSLHEMLDHDADMISMVLDTFVAATEENLRALQTALSDKDIERVAQLAHKMLPMFLQIGDQLSAALLEKMEKYRGKQVGELPGWEYEVKTVIDYTEKLIEEIRKDNSERMS